MQGNSRILGSIPSLRDIDSVRQRQKKIGKERDLALLETCGNLWQNNELFRRQRARAFRFTYVDQLADIIEVDGRTMTMRKYLLSQGNVALQTNQMKNKVETMEGVIVKESLEPVCNARDRQEQQYGELMTTALQANCSKNKMNKLEVAWTKEACLGGLMVAYESWDDTSGPNGSKDTWTQYVNPNMVFFDAKMDDPRFWDMNIIGRIKKYDFGKLCASFARDEKDYAILRDIYRPGSDVFRTVPDMNYTDRYDDGITGFMQDPDPNVCCVCEVWTKETKARLRLHDVSAGEEIIVDADDAAMRKQIRRENERRKALAQQGGVEIGLIEGDGYGEDEVSRNGFFVDEFWYCRDLAPDGTILWEGESPYPDRQHPFSIAAIPMIDGQIVGYLYDMIDHNIIMNRAICLNDWLIRTNAKGVVVVPKSIIPDDMDPQEFANSWTSMDGMVFIDVKPGMENMMPKVFYGQAQTFDVAKYLDTFNRMGDKSTAITDALQGRTPLAGTSGTMYAQMAQHSTTAIASFLSSIHSFLEDVHTKKMKNIIAFYEPERLAKIAGDIDSITGNANMKLFDVGNVEYDLSLTESADSPIHRAIINDDAKAFLMGGLISLEEYLTIASVPYADKLLQMRQARQAEVQAAQQNGQLPAPAKQDPQSVGLTQGAEQIIQ